MVYYAMPLIMKSENGGSSQQQQLCMNTNQVVVSESSYNGPLTSPQPQQPQLISLQNTDVNGSSPSQQNNYTYQLLTSNDHQVQQQHHQQQQHQNGLATTSSQRTQKQTKSFKCEQCNMTFTTKSAHTSHTKSHAKQQVSQINANSGNVNGSQQMQSSDPYQCDVCKKTFAVPARLVRHYRTHTGERPFECEFCHKMFSVKENLQVHRRIHTKERPYKCDVCGRAFEHSGKLHRHMRIHTGERPHKCNICSKTFIQSGQLVIHLRTHTGEKPYKCNYEGCGKGFTCSKQLKVHSRTHTGEKPYHCDICFRDFGYNHVLKLHRVQHYGSKCYKCTICDETFKNKKEMEAHIKGHANDIPDDDNVEDMANDRSCQQPQETKHSILLNTPSTSSPTTPSPNNITMNHPVVTKYETNESSNQHLMNFAEQFSIMNSVTPAPSTSITTVYPDTPKDSEASSEQNSDGDDVTYMNMYSRFEQSVVNQYGMSSGVNSALLAVASITASATLQPVTPTSNSNTSSNLCNNLITLKPIQQTSSASSVQQVGYDSTQIGLGRSNSNGYFVAANTVQQSNDYKPSNLVRCVEAALELTPPRSSPESPDRSSSPDSDSLLMADRDNNTLPPRKRKLYFKDNQPNAATPKSQARMSSVIQFAKAS
ncbi:CLUMA_CG009886, isoform A [Clunio marinus]|uniref:CLUMA_CG009886, isoform A n=1 Tax=Clunio marinus TaxID=568069 RepID=A0A1J1I8F4_9DIPT|nr:CLUMA_CG009886, isoform A [Clunio marinus]